MCLCQQLRPFPDPVNDLLIGNSGFLHQSSVFAPIYTVPEIPFLIFEHQHSAGNDQENTQNHYYRTAGRVLLFTPGHTARGSSFFHV